MALKAHIPQFYGKNSYFKQDSFPKVLNFLSVTVLDTYAGTHGF